MPGKENARTEAAEFTEITESKAELSLGEDAAELSGVAGELCCHSLHRS